MSIFDIPRVFAHFKPFALLVADFHDFNGSRLPSGARRGKMDGS